MSRTVLWVCVLLYCLYSIISLRSEVKDLRSKLRDFYDEYHRFTTSKIHHPEHAHKQTPTAHAEKAISTPAIIPDDDYGLHKYRTEPIPESTDTWMPIQEVITTPDAPIIQDARQTVSTTVVDTGPSYMDVFLDWFRVDWPMKIGGLVFILGIGWFLIYAIQNNWIPAEIRILMWVVLGAAMIGFGRYKIPSQNIQWSYMVWLGSAVYVLSIYIGYKFFWFFGTTMWLWLIVIQYLLMAYLSYRYKNHWLNDVSLFFSMVCPFLFSDGSWNVIWLFSYLAIHLVGNGIVSYHYNRSVSRLMWVWYLWLYLIAGLMWSLVAMWSGMMIGIIVAIVMCMTFLEVWIGRTRSDWFSPVQLATISALGVALFAYLTLMVYANSSVVSPMTYTSICIYFALWYGVLWYMYSISHKQDAYSGIVWVLSVLFICGITFYNLSGIGLMLASILICDAIQALTTLVTKDSNSVGATSVWWVIPVILALYNFDSSGASSGYLVAIYTWCVMLWWLATLYHYRLSSRFLTTISGIGSVVLLYFAICNTFDGSTRIIVLETLSIVLALIGSIIHLLSKSKYLQFGLVSIVLPFIYILGQWVDHTISTFTMILWLIIALGSYVVLSYKLETQDIATETTLTWWAIGTCIFLLYFGVCTSFDGSIRIIILETISLGFALVWSIIHLKKLNYLWLWLSTIIPLWYILAQWIHKDMWLFWLIIGLIVIVGCFIYYSRSLQSSDKDMEQLLSNGIVAWWCFLLYLSVGYIASADYYTVIYTALSMLIYFVGSRVRNAWSMNKLYYSWFMIVPMIASISLLDNSNTFITTLSQIIVSISLLWLRLDNEDHPAMSTWWYLYYFFGLLYFWLFGFGVVRNMADADTAIVAMLIVFIMIGIWFYIYGKLHSNKQYSHIGTAIIIGVIARVLIVELRQMTLIMRIITCLAIGWLLVASGFIGNKGKEEIGDEQEQELINN